MTTNQITVVGNATKDAELRYSPAGKPMGHFSVACNRKWQNRQTNEWEESTSFFNVVVWNEQAENVCESVEKGTRVVVTGRLEQRQWETPEGDKRSTVEIVADEVGVSLRYATAEVRRNERREAVSVGEEQI